MRKAFLVAVLWVNVLALGAPLISATVSRVLDGATLEVRIEGLPVPAPSGLRVGDTVIVRYIGVALPSEPAEAEKLRTLNATLVEGRTVYLELEEGKAWEDGGLWAYVFLDPDQYLFVNAILVATPLAGFAPPAGVERYNHILAYMDALPQAPPGLSCTVLYSWDEARRHVGEIACVEGPVASVGTSRGGDVFLNLGRPYPDPGRFTLFIPARYVGKFEALFGARFWTKLVGVQVRALGEIRLYQGVPEIQLSEPENLLILR